MKQQMFVINGRGGSGKDTFVGFCRIHGLKYNAGVMNISTVDRVKMAAELLGWDGSKDYKNRKFLSDLKDISTAMFDGPFNYIEARWESALKFKNNMAMFVHCREPQEIDRLVKSFKAQTVLVERNGIGEYGNHADDNVNNFAYDHYIENHGILIDLNVKAGLFMKNAFSELE